MTPSQPYAQIAHTLVIDIAGFSTRTADEQRRQIIALNVAVEAAPVFVSARSIGGVRPLPTGDGMALLFFTEIAAPALLAIEVSRLIASSLPLRMGIHSGLVQTTLDISGGENAVGEGINTAHRVMDFADPGHILLSAPYADWLLQIEGWKSCLEALGEGIAKHGQRIGLYNLRGDGYGRKERPSRLTDAVSSQTTPQTAQKKVTVLYKRNLKPDGDVLHTVEERLDALGFDVFVDRNLRIGIEWARAIETRIRESDAVVAIVSPPALQSEMLEYEMETARDQYEKTGKPLILPIWTHESEPVEGIIADIIHPLNQFRWTGENDNPRLVAELASALSEPPKPQVAAVRLESIGGAVPLDSPFYVERTADREFFSAISAGESILLVRGARQIGKTSLLARGIRHTKSEDRRCAFTDFQKLSQSQLKEDNAFYRLLAASLGKQLGFKYDFAGEWDEAFGPNLNLENFLRELLDADPRPLVWMMDETDKLFSAPFASDFFGLVRSWHNARSTEFDGPWGKLTVAIAYATEAHLFIQDVNQSPFNVGRKIELQDFNLQQLLDLNERYGSPLNHYHQAEKLRDLIGGHPFLTRRALDALAGSTVTLDALLSGEDLEGGPFSDHLKRLLVSVTHLPEIEQSVIALLKGETPRDRDAMFRLISSGVLTMGGDGKMQFRCELYRRYLMAQLTPSSVALQGK